MLLTGEGDPAEGEAQAENIYIKNRWANSSYDTQQCKNHIPQGKLFKGIVTLFAVKKRWHKLQKANRSCEKNRQSSI